jgi:hypothetical protein
MRKPVAPLSLLLILPLLGLASLGKDQPSSTTNLTLNPSTRFDLANAQIQWQEYRGRQAAKLAPLPGHERDVDQEMQATLLDSDFQDGTIEIDVAGARRQGYSTAEDTTGYKGMIGITFRIQNNKSERFYVRPQNARLNNQLFRNRSTQYESAPDFPWDQLRKDHPGEYESYVDLDPGAWTHLKIEVSGSKARLYVNNAPQPCLIVNELKQGSSRGKIALWARISTDAYFSNLKLSPTPGTPIS